MSTTGSSTVPVRRKRRRPLSACEPCRRKKVKCDRIHPICTPCTKSKIDECIYITLPPPANGKRSKSNGGQDHHHLLTPSSLNTDAVHIESSGQPVEESLGKVIEYYNTATPQSGEQRDPEYIVDCVPNTTRLRNQVEGLETQIKQSGNAATRDVIEGSESKEANLYGTFSKTRFFGPSHWMNFVKQFHGITKILGIIESGKQKDIIVMFDKCKRIGRDIKAQQSKERLESSDFKECVPPKEITDKLVESYFRTCESVYRVSHIPTFEKEYEKYWQDPSSANILFVIKLLLISAIGSWFHQECRENIAFRNSTLKWIYQIATWLGFLSAKRSRFTIHILQINCLLLIARENLPTAIGGDLVCISADALLRTAMIMGLHRDPSRFPNMSPFDIELRRRLWATILEIALQSNANVGGSVLISIQDFDTKPPSNLNDAQLDPDSRVTPVSKPDSIYTQSSLQIALMKTFAVRLEISKALTNFRADLSFEEALRLSSKLNSVNNAVFRQFQSCCNHINSNPSTPNAYPTLLQSKTYEFMTQRFLLALHQNFTFKAMHNPTYYYSRKVCVDASLTTLSQSTSLIPSLRRATKWSISSSSSTPAQQEMETQQETDYNAVLLCGIGIFRFLPLQCSLLIFLELLTQLSQTTSTTSFSYSHLAKSTSSAYTASTIDLSPSDLTLQQSMFDAMENYTNLMLARIKVAGETNIKGHVFASCLITQAKALQDGKTDKEIESEMLDAGRESLRLCHSILRDRALEMGATIAAEDLDPVSISDPSGMSKNIHTSSTTVDGATNGDGNAEYRQDVNQNTTAQPVMPGVQIAPPFNITTPNTKSTSDVNFNFNTFDWFGASEFDDGFFDTSLTGSGFDMDGSSSSGIGGNNNMNIADLWFADA